MMNPEKSTVRVLITGVTGQDGAYLAKALLDDGYKVFGTVRRGGSPKTDRLKSLGILERVILVPLEITEFPNVIQVLSDIRPDYIYNFSAQSFVMDSFTHPITTTQVNYIGVLNLLESMKILNLDSRFLQPSSSEMYGSQEKSYVSEETRFNPFSPYAVAKHSAHCAVQIYRTKYHVKAASAILFNHESELRGREFVTRKITYHLARLNNDNIKPLKLGNLSASRDWGYAVDFVKAMKLILEDHSMDEYIIATGEMHSVRQFLELAATYAGFSPKFEGIGLAEKCYDQVSGKVICEISEDLFRPLDTVYLRGNFSKIQNNLGWEPTTSFNSMVERMVMSDMDQIENKVYFY